MRGLYSEDLAKDESMSAEEREVKLRFFDETFPARDEGYDPQTFVSTCIGIGGETR